MADNIIRQDIVQIGFDTDFDELLKLSKELDELKKSLKGGIGDDAFDDLKDGANDSVKPLKKVKEQAKEVVKQVTEIGKKAATTAFNGLKKLAGVSFKALTVGIGAAVAGIGALVSKSVSAYADLEQLRGGVETLFGAGGLSIEDYAKSVGKSVSDVKSEYNNLIASQDTVFKNANNAYKTAGISANDYMDTVTSFSASLISSLGGDTKAAAKLADQAIVGMSDNANKMGTDMDSIIQTYQSLAKGNYAMLDNLKLGYGGTKTELQRLIKDASKMTDVQEKLGVTVDSSSLSFANIINAINVVQENMGIAGTTAKEAEGTISGSLASLKSTWANLMPALIEGGDSFDQCVDNLVDSALIFGKNIKPAILKALSGVGTLIEELAPIIEDEFPKLVDELLPPLIKASVALVQGLIKALPSIASVLIKEIPDILKMVGDTIVETFGKEFPVVQKFADWFKDIGDFFKDNADKIKKFIPVLIGLFAAFKLFKGLKSITSIFGGLSKGGSGGKSGGITGIFSSLAKTKSSVIAKGMANLAIILGGITIMSAAFAAVAPHIAKLSDGKSMVELIAIVGSLGVLGTALAKLAEIVGKIPVATVAKGLANMAIVLVGFGALATVFAWVAPFIASLSDMKSILKVAAIMGVLGILGTALSVFAGIAGLIPIPVVLTGLANMALVLGGVSALIVAFGALSQIKGFSEFIESGGKILAQIFGVIGEMVGSLAGGLLEGISGLLPAVGKSLGEFGKNIKPLFTSIKGVDMGGVGTFFTSLVGLLGIATGNEIIEGIKSFFGGDEESSLSKLGTQLSDFATNSKSFFATVSELPENGFTNATKLFDCLAGLKGLPKEGGVVGWFKGDINYTTIADGLKQLSSEKVIGFFNAVSELKQTGFDNAKLLFDTLAGLKSLPKNGGVVGWFCGDVDYSQIATGLGQLSGEKVKNFFTMVGALKQKAFDNAKLFFDCLANIGDLPKEGGWWDKLTGTETSTLGNIAKELGSFGDKTATFFEQVNSLNLKNLNGLWDSLNKSKDVTANVSQIVDDNISDIVKKVSELPKKMGEGLKQSGQSLGDALVSVWKDAVKASVAPVNKVLEAANWILKEFGSKKRVIKWTPYARGTDGHKGGNALVNDGGGAELVQMPNGNAFIPKGRNVLIPNAPKGMKVLPANQTAQLMGHKTPTYSYANGIGDIDIWSYIDNPSGLVNKISGSVDYKGMSGFTLSVGKGMVSTFTGEMSAWIEKLFEEEGALSLANYVASKGVSQWRSTVIRALKMEGQYSAANVTRTLHQMQTESGGNPKAINLWDSNAKKGIPSKGLMQVIDPTFRAYARSGFDKNIYDPLSNILASIRYAVSRYGTLAKAYRGVGYANGGFANKPSIFGEDGLEAAIPLSKDKRKRGLSLWAQTGEMLGVSGYTPEHDTGYYASNTVENNTYAPQFSFTISGTNDDRAIARKVKRAVAEAWNEMLTGYESKMPRTQEV